MFQWYRLVAVITIVVAATVCPMSLFGNEYYVDVESRGGTADDSNPGSKSKPWKTISRAFKDGMTSLKGGDTLWVRGGVYKETVNITCSGQENNPVTIKAFPGEKPVVDGNGKAAYGINIKAVNYLTIEGLTIVNMSPKGRAVTISNATGVIFKKNTIKSASCGMFFSACKKLRILECDIGECFDNGIVSWGGSWDIVVADNHVHHNGSWDYENSQKRYQGDGICIRGPADFMGSRGVLDKIESVSKGLARFSIKDPKTGEPVKLNFMRAWSQGVVGKGDKGTERWPPTVLLLYYSEKPQYLDDKMLPGGSALLASGDHAFPLRSNPEWNNEPYSPDELYGLIETGGTPVEELAKAKYACLYFRWIDAEQTIVDLQVVRNEVDHNGRQGILITRCNDVLIKDNKVHDGGATGIQVEGQCRNFWVEGNESYANSQQTPNETGMWMWGVEDCIVQNNRCYENMRGLWVGKTGWSLVRWNVFYDNRGQHGKGFHPIYTNVLIRTLAEDRAMGIALGGKGLNILPECHWITGPVSILHNTLVGNGTDKILHGAGGVAIGMPFRAAVENSVFLNNIVVQNDAGKQSLSVMDLGAVMDGNLYYNYGRPFTVIFTEGEKRWLTHKGPGITSTPYVITEPAGLQKYRAERKKDEHSLVAAVDFVDAEKKDFHLKKGSEGIDKAVPLAATVSEGSGNEIPVDRADCFSDGFRNSKGELLIPGDEIMVGGQRCRIETIDRQQSKLRINRKLSWAQGAPVTYVYKGQGPDIGAYETGGSWFTEWWGRLSGGFPSKGR